MEGSTVSGLTRQDSVEAASDPEVTAGAAGEGAPEPERSTDGVIIGLGDSDLAGTVGLAAGSAFSGQIDVYCCSDGAYSVYVYEGGRCDDAQSWAVENSARVAELSCAHDVGTVAYVRDPSEHASAAFVVYDAAGTAVGCADVAAE